MPNLVWDWLERGRSLYDPEYDEATQTHFLDAWGEVMESREHWQKRDKEPTVEVSISLKPWEFDSLRIVAGFLDVTREVLLVAVLTSAALGQVRKRSITWDAPPLRMAK